MRYLFSIAFICLGYFIQSQTTAAFGKLDLSDYDASEPVRLDGEWKVYPNQILDPSQFHEPAIGKSYFVDFRTDWSDIPQMGHKGSHCFGYATYTLDLLVPEGLPRMSFKLHEINTAYKLYLNGKKIYHNGEVGTSKETSTPYWKQDVRQVDLQEGSNEIMLVVSNFHHDKGGPIKPITLGSESQIHLLKNLEVGSVIFLVGCLIISGIFALGLFWFRPRDYSGLIFMFFCFSYAYWMLGSNYHVVNSVFPDMQWAVYIRAEYISLSLAVILYSYFIKIITDDYLKPVLFHTISAVSGLFCLLSLLAPVSFFTMFTGYYYIFLGLSFSLVSVLALQQFNFTHKLAWVNIIGVLSLMTVVGNKILGLYDLVIENPIVNIVGSVLFIFTQALALAIRFGRNYRESSVAALSAVRTRDEFLNTMSHELKTPMNAILGMATFLEKSNLNVQQKDKLHAIKSNGESLLSLINDVLSISEVGTGKLTLKPQPVNVESCVESAVNLSRQHLRKDTVRFSMSVDPDIPSLLVGDSSRIKQILMHLLSNAFKYTERGDVELSIMLLNQNEEGSNIGFTIRDTGIGIDKTQYTKMFDIFKQGQLGNTRKYGGAGLGLTVVNELVGMMGGQLSVRSKKGIGTLINFNIQLAAHKVNKEREVTSIFKRNEIDTSLKVLYAEDNPVNQKLLQMMLENVGLNVDVAKNGEEAVQMALKKYYNIIFMDIQMPVLDGIEATRRIIENSSSRSIIIAVTANLATVDKRNCFEAGMNDFLSKPVQQDELKLAVIKWQGLKKYLDETEDSFARISS